jgi:LemA protein
MKRSTIIILAVVGVILLWGISVRNGLATSDNGLKGAWGEVEVNYQRKAKLYESLVNTIKGAATNEDTTLIKIVQMRSRIADVKPGSGDVEQLQQANKQYSDMGRAMLNINIEAYPTLKATDLFANLQANVEGTENRVARAISEWNTAVTAYNTKVIKFPSNLIAGVFGYTTKQNFKADEGAKDSKVDFGVK